MFEALGDLIADAIEKQRQGTQSDNPVVPRRVVVTPPPPSPAALASQPSFAPAAAAPPAVAPDFMLPIDAPAAFPQLGGPPPASPLLAALRGGQALIGGIVVAQVLGPPPALRPHKAPADTL